MGSLDNARISGTRGQQLRKRSVPPVPSSVPLTADEKQTLIGFHRRQFVGHHRKGRSLRRASTTASNSVARFGVLHLTSSDELGEVKNPASCATFMRPGVLNRLVSTNCLLGHKLLRGRGQGPGHLPGNEQIERENVSSAPTVPGVVDALDVVADVDQSDDSDWNDEEDEGEEKDEVVQDNFLSNR
ncbi:hypothetical protein HPB51_000738 [Rhipicephalus microplus]|uniref:Uncharacterized protein n=1 Tax=Rhipicephalus microplus TaxID=6941 RepID=A0A9J6EVG5_RHIMP|nr:hypothetical protein HPB51_000738 [Rhipicephalus microplus]